MKKDTKSEWAVIFLIKAVGEHFLFAEQMLNEILSSSRNREIVYLFCLHGKVEALKKLPIWSPSATGPAERDLTTLFFTIERDNTSGRSQFKLIDEKPDFRLSDKDCLQNYFREKILPLCNAEKYLLFTWDHGTQFGIFVENVPQLLEEKAHLEIAPKNTSTQVPGSKKYSFLIVDNHTIYDQSIVSFDASVLMDKYASAMRATGQGLETLQPAFNTAPNSDVLPTVKEKLSITELAQALKWGFGDKKIDLMVMMNCRMQFFDIGLTLSHAVNYLVTPLTAISFSGYNYEVIFETINRRPGILPQQLASVVVTSFKTKMFSDKAIRKFELASTILFANNLFHYPAIGTWINSFSDRLINILDARFRTINNARTHRINTINEDYKMVDLCQFVSSTKTDKYYPLTEKDSRRLKRLIRSAIIQRYAGTSPIAIDASKKKPLSPSGIGVFFPMNKNDILGNESFNIFFMDQLSDATKFARLFRWDSFISSYLKKSAGV